MDRIESKMLPIIAATRNDSLKRRVLRWMLHLQFAMEVYGTGKGDESLLQRCDNITMLRNKDVNCSCRWPLDGSFAERTWKHIRSCLWPYIQKNKEELERSAKPRCMRKETGQPRGKVDM